jgi:hypothetical protein
MSLTHKQKGKSSYTRKVNEMNALTELGFDCKVRELGLTFRSLTTVSVSSLLLSLRNTSQTLIKLHNQNKTLQNTELNTPQIIQKNSPRT